jgi:hypothetical protein
VKSCAHSRAHSHKLINGAAHRDKKHYSNLIGWYTSIKTKQASPRSRSFLPLNKPLCSIHDYRRSYHPPFPWTEKFSKSKVSRVGLQYSVTGCIIHYSRIAHHQQRPSSPRQHFTSFPGIPTTTFKPRCPLLPVLPKGARVFKNYRRH